MSFFKKTPLGENGKHFYFDGYRLIDSMVTFFSDDNAVEHAKINITYTGKASQTDKQNILDLMEQLDAIYMQNRMKDQFLRNNENRDGAEIKNNSQRDQFNQVKKVNAALAVFFMYFLHRFYWKQWEDVPGTTNDQTQIEKYQDPSQCQPTGRSINNVMSKIKAIYPQLFNLFALLIEEKFPGQSRIALMQVQDMNARTQEITTLGQQPILSVKKSVKIKPITN